MNNKRIWIFLLYGILAFALLWWELVSIFWIEPLLFHHKPIQNYGTKENIIHWILTIIGWGIGALLLIFNAKKNTHFDILKQKEAIKPNNLIIASLIAILCIGYNVWILHGFKPALELADLGLLSFIFQYIYYIFEVILIFLITSFGQEFGKNLFKNKWFPWGGVFTALTWGLLHIITQGALDVGLECASFGICFGIIYNLTNKNTYITYLLIYIAFVI